MSTKGDPALKVFASNRAARHNYNIVEKLEAGLVLTGAEVKSVRASQVVLKDSFATVRGGEVYLHNVHITPYSHARTEGQDPDRSRKLLLHKKEILKLEKATRQDGYTLVPLRLYLKGGVVKCELGVAKGKKTHDKRQAGKAEDARRQIRDALGRRRKGM